MNTLRLTLSTTGDWLRSRGYLSSASIVRGGFKVTDASRRHRNFTVAIDDRRLFLKQSNDEAGASAVTREADLYLHLHDRSKSGEFFKYVPRLIGYDAECGVLILEWLDDALSLREYHLRRGQFPRRIGEMLGAALGALHQLPAAAFEEKGGGRELSRPPWVLWLHRPNLLVLQKSSAASLELIRIVQQYDQFAALLEELSRNWSTSTPIHNDLKSENILLRSDAVDKDESALKIVDWELARIGDPCWDAGSIFHDYLMYWLYSMPISGDMPSAKFVPLARHPLKKMHPALAMFWNTYTRQMRVSPEAAPRWRLRAVQYAGARILQTTFEQMQVSNHLTGAAVCAVQLCLNMLQRPEVAAVQLLGLSPRGSRPEWETDSVIS